MHHHSIGLCVTGRTGLIVLLATATLLSACTPASITTTPVTPSSQEATREEGNVLAEQSTASLTPEPVDEARFTVQAEDALQPALAALYAAQDPDRRLVFVSGDADLQTATDLEAAAELGEQVYVFLPDAALALLNNNPDAAAFAAFTVSPDGQQALIDAGFLPDVVTLIDQAGNTVEIPQPVRRVVSPYGVATFYVYTVGAGDRLVAAGYMGARDPAGETAMTRIDPRYPTLGSFSMSQRELNVEEVAALEPDLIITSARSAWLDAAAELGIPIFLFEGETPGRLKEAVLLTGQIFGPNTAAQAEAWVRYYDAIVETVTAQTGSLEESGRVRVLFTGTDPLSAASGNMYQSSIISMAGGVSVSADLTGYWNDVSLEQVVIWDPDVVLVPPYGGASVEAIIDSPEWQVLEAVQGGRVFRVPKLVAPWDVPAPDSVLGIIWLAQKLYPDQVNLDCASETGRFYQSFYQYEISADEVVDLCGS